MSEPDKTFADAGTDPDAQTKTQQGVDAGTETEKRKRPTLSSSDTFTSSYEPKTDPFLRHVERVFEGIGVVQIPDFVHDSYDKEIMGHYKEYTEVKETMREMHRKNLEEKDKEHINELKGLYQDRNKYKNLYRDELHKSVENMNKTLKQEQNYKDQLSQLHQDLQNARTRPATAEGGFQAGPATAEGGFQADEHDIRREHEYGTAAFTSRYNEHNFNTGDKRRPSPFREQTRGLEPTNKYHIGAR
jgi:hypothetical protein